MHEDDLTPPQWLVTLTDKFDQLYEAKHKDGEPGANPEAPYYMGHMVASAVEQIVAMLLHVDYNAYESAVDKSL